MSTEQTETQFSPKEGNGKEVSLQPNILEQLADRLEAAYQSKEKMARRDLLGIAKEVVGDLKPGLKVTIPPELAVAVPPLVAWAMKGKLPPAERQRRGLIALGALGIIVVLSGAGLHRLVLKKEEWAEKKKEDRRLRALPEDWQEEIKRRNDAEKSETYQIYKEGGYVYAFDPTHIGHPLVQQMYGEIGPTWMFESERKAELEEFFGRDFTEEEIDEFRANPQKAYEIAGMMVDLQKRIRAAKAKLEKGEVLTGVEKKLAQRKDIDDDVIDFYQK